MSKILHILLFVTLTVALCSAVTQHSRTARIQAKRNRFLARQEVADAAPVTPYPSADELKPEVPFDEAAVPEEQQPNQPDEVYGPPEDEAAIGTDEVAEAEPAAAEVDDQTAVVEESSPARLTARRSSSARRSSVRPAKLRKAAPARLQLKPQFVPQPVFFYVAH